MNWPYALRDYRERWSSLDWLDRCCVVIGSPLVLAALVAVLPILMVFYIGATVMEFYGD